MTDRPLTEEQLSELRAVLARYAHYSVPAPITREDADILRHGCSRLLAELDDYRNTIAWNVDCVQCAKYLDKSYEDYNRIKELEVALVELVTLKDHVKESDPEDYERRKEPAWEAARKAMGKEE